MDRVAPALLMGTWLPAMMIQRHEQQPGAGDGDDSIDGDLYNIHDHHPFHDAVAER